MFNPKLYPTWEQVFENEFNQEYFQKLIKKLSIEYGQYKIYPDKSQIFNAFKFTTLHNIKAVIIGQDPYHGHGQANGLSFSVSESSTKLPPSLKNIFKELASDLEISIPEKGNLENWAKQGVLLLNSCLTVREKSPNSHNDLGWQIFTNHIISYLNDNKEDLIFILWGKHAQLKLELIDEKKHHIIKSPHPSPFSARKGFFGSSPFSSTNEYLKSIGKKEIDWKIN